MAYINITARMGGILTPIITGLLLENDNGFLITIILFGCLFGSVAIYLIFIPETKQKAKEVKNTKEQLLRHGSAKQ